MQCEIRKVDASVNENLLHAAFGITDKPGCLFTFWANSEWSCERYTGLFANVTAPLHVTDEFNRQQAGISSQTTEYVARHPVYTQRVHSYSRLRSQKLDTSSG